MSYNRTRHAEVVERMRVVVDEMEQLGTHDNPTRPQRQRFDSLTDELESLTREERQHRLDRITSGSNLKTERGTPGSSSDEYDYDPAEGRPRGGSTRDQAMRAIERAAIPAEAQEKAERLLGQGAPVHRSLAERWVLATGSQAYERAFAHLVADPERGHLMWDEEERAAFAAVQKLRGEMRALSLTDNEGGYMVPFHLDPAILLTSGGSVDPMRRLARVVQTSSDVWHGVTSAGVTASWRPEEEEASDDSPSFGQPSIPVHKGNAWVPFSIEIGMDMVGTTQELGRLLVDAADQLQATAFATGTGTNQPKGIVTALAGTASEINGSGTEVLTAADPFTLQNALPPRFRPRAEWMAALPIINTLRQFETTNGSLKFPELANGNLLGRPISENSNMDGSLNPAATASNFVMIYGDFANYVIVDRIGTTIELVPHLFGPNRRPTGQRGLYMYFRTGGDVVVPEAFRMLDVPTTA
ncbi:phage major capsid protein [Nonomuraea sp. LP-02]|uniref:phage major capsid protein n=1 Tax=Nonomuraea sp. LP-02 TaxID=3097960 RepID=UPI002E300427|nr:phage major capsid protein [Nonomuraea sp. LP-02]MED7929312.1 phage major capsid protein [Nonomuraea sp. LP-02]